MGPQRAPWPLLGLPRPRRACRCSWMPRAPDTAGSTELRPKGDATSARQLAASEAALSYSALCAEANASSSVDGAEPKLSSRIWSSTSQGRPRLP